MIKFLTFSWAVETFSLINRDKDLTELRITDAVTPGAVINKTKGNIFSL